MNRPKMSEAEEWKRRYERLHEASYGVYHELLSIATHLDDRRPVQKRVWNAARKLMGNS